jgi:hypothetical protein
VAFLLHSLSRSGGRLWTRSAQAKRPATGSYEPITGKQRLKWFVTSTVGPESLMAGLFSAGFSTSSNSPSEYGPHWEGFGKRYGMRLTGVSTGHAIEATVGSLWGEDPRYFRAEGQPLKGRVKNIVVMTFLARRRDGNLAPAYARFIGSAGNNFCPILGGLTVRLAPGTPVVESWLESRVAWQVTHSPNSGRS